jgi:hypothetical protein
MRTVKTVNGIKKIEDVNMDLVPLQLREIMQQHRATLIDKLLGSELDHYIEYKFNRKASPVQLKEIKENLHQLKNSGIDLQSYLPVFDNVLNNTNSTLDNRFFYEEIDLTIKSSLSEPKLFNDSLRISFQ